MHIFKKLLYFGIPSAVFFEDGSRVDYLSKSGTLIYVSPIGCGIQITVLRDKSNGELHIEMPNVWEWDKPAGKFLSDEEMRDVKIKITQYVEKQGKPFSISET
jgi:hypothetical protein